MIEYLTATMTLLAGDIIATGTPVGVSNMNPGGLIEIELDGGGTLQNYVAWCGRRTAVRSPVTRCANS
jgi:5-oxopent-3-ene-1,2,5-tricarboxylate decarboxylase / 2-hydroxyhepta-2,4-diene-1,7-dioate isomerase